MHVTGLRQVGRAQFRPMASSRPSSRDYRQPHLNAPWPGIVLVPTRRRRSFALAIPATALSVVVASVPAMTTSANNAAMWATSAANKFREVARTTENETTRALAEGLTHLAEAIRVLDGA